MHEDWNLKNETDLYKTKLGNLQLSTKKLKYVTKLLTGQCHL